MSKKELKIYIDGASRGNPGKAGIGVLIKKDNEKVTTVSESIGRATNNIAEYKALIYALEEAEPFTSREIKIFSDSELLVNQVTGKYKVKSENLKSLYDKVAELAQKFNDIDIEKISREDNTEADKLANEAIDKSNAIFPKHSS